MKALIITLAGALIATGVQLLPGSKHHVGGTGVPKREIKTYQQIAPEQKMELAVKERIPVDCKDYLGKYGWNQSVAYNVMMVESGNKPTNLNDNPSTGDYSVGCFQINLLGGNLQSKYGIMVRLGYGGPMEREAMKHWLWEPGNNVAVAWELYKGSKWQPWSFTTCKKVACY